MMSFASSAVIIAACRKLVVYRYVPSQSICIAPINNSAIRRIKSTVCISRRSISIMECFTIKNGLRYALTVSCLQRYKNMFGDMKVPQKYVIPLESELWPEEAWGLKLGLLVRDIRRGIIFKIPSQQKELKEIGFHFSPQIQCLGYPIIKLALIHYHRVHGHLRVPQKFFTADDDESWPEGTRGIALGAIVAAIRNNGSFENMKEELISLGFEYGLQNGVHDYELTRSALLQYKAIYGDLRIKRSFKVSERDETWSKDAWGMALGTIVASIRRSGRHCEHREELKRMGIDFHIQKKTHSFEVVKRALLTHKDLYGTMLMRKNFIVPECHKWPEETWGLLLGRVVQDIRGGRLHKNKHDELIENGFPMIDPLQSSEEVYQLKSNLRLFKKIHGHFDVPVRFIIPEEGPWDMEHWGMKLGKTVQGIKKRKTIKTRNLSDDLVSCGILFAETERGNI